MLVDDNQDFLDVAGQWISAQPSLCLVGTAKNGDDAVEKIASLRPDLIMIDVPTVRPVLVLMDMLMPLIDGLQAAARFKAVPNPPKVVLMSVHEPELQGMAFGADAFLKKADFASRFSQLVDTLFGSRNPDHKTEDFIH
jgi:CheY-like chemotaxis protein